LRPDRRSEATTRANARAHVASKVGPVTRSRRSQARIHDLIKIGTQPIEVHPRQSTAGSDELGGCARSTPQWHKFSNFRAITGHHERLASSDTIENFAAMIAQLSHRD
jgi:hypothetical protein